MLGIGQLNFDLPGGIGLRTELSFRALAFAKTRNLLYERTDGSVPGVLFGQDEGGRHGNFHALAYQKICSKPQWAGRLGKVHTAFKRSRVRANWQWKELDCAHSSDALLMSIFCHPDVMTATSVRAMLGIESEATPEFGFKPRAHFPLALTSQPHSAGRSHNVHLRSKQKPVRSAWQRAAVRCCVPA